jgi:hypothetical protein
MRTALLLAAVFGVFGTGCGGCVDDKNAPAPSATAPTVNVPARNVSHIRLAIDGGGGPGLGDPPPAADR